MTPKEIKDAVRKRDGKCVDCGRLRSAGNRSLHVHRLVPGSEYTLEGCVTVCSRCHAVRHEKPSGPTWYAIRTEEAVEASLEAMIKLWPNNKTLSHREIRINANLPWNLSDPAIKLGRERGIITMKGDRSAARYELTNRRKATVA